MFGVAGVLAPPEQQQQEFSEAEDLEGEPLPWTESLGTGGPLHYAGLMRWHVNALQVGVGVGRKGGGGGWGVLDVGHPLP